MAGIRNEKVISRFFCINCGKEGIPLWRGRGNLRQKGHRKALYCMNCRMRINHVEVQTEAEARQFMEDFAAGMYIEEAEKSVEYAKEHERKGE